MLFEYLLIYPHDKPTLIRARGPPTVMKTPLGCSSVGIATGAYMEIFLKA